jgi:hypothetical protein
MKSTFYFDHDYNARNDLKILELRSVFGWEGYGLFWALIETLCEQAGHIKREALTGLSLGLSTDKALLIKLIDFCIEVSLLYEDEEGIFSSRTLEHLGYRKMLSDYGKKGGRPKNEDNEKPALSTPLASLKPVKERKEEESIGKNRKEEQSKEEREKEFRKQVFSFNQKYSDKMLLAFFNYWSEKSKSGKMRWEMEKTYEIEKRLVTWHSREKGTEVVSKGYDPSYYVAEG